LVELPIAATDSFPVLGVTVMYFSHEKKMIDSASGLVGTGVSVTELSRSLATTESN
jgi:hypothetical protein